jgi:hypothetical protein
MITPSQSSHWYTKAGDPAYGAGLREARKQDLVPSVTSIIGLLDKPGVNVWKVNTMLECAYTEPVNGKDFAAWREAVESTWERETTRAAELGTYMHDYAQSIIEKKYSPLLMNDYYQHKLSIKNWIEGNHLAGICEESFCVDGLYPYGGRIDFSGYMDGIPKVLIDFKTQAVKNGKPTYYPEWAMQLAAYREHVGRDFVCMSVVIDTINPGVSGKVYTEDEIDASYDTFTTLAELFYRLKKLA